MKNTAAKKYDMVEANIVADIIIALTKQVPDYIKDGGNFPFEWYHYREKRGCACGTGGRRPLTCRMCVSKKGWVAIASKYVG